MTAVPNWAWLAAAIVSEVFATSLLKLSDRFTKPVPSLAVVIGYALAFYCLSAALRTIPIGIAYAIWCGAGIVLVTLVAWVFHGQRLAMIDLAGIALILAGTLLLNARIGAGS